MTAHDEREDPDTVLRQLHEQGVRLVMEAWEAEVRPYLDTDTGDEWNDPAWVEGVREDFQAAAHERLAQLIQTAAGYMVSDEELAVLDALRFLGRRAPRLGNYPSEVELIMMNARSLGWRRVT